PSAAAQPYVNPRDVGSAAMRRALPTARVAAIASAWVVRSSSRSSTAAVAAAAAIGAPRWLGQTPRARRCGPSAASPTAIIAS
ncbi:MAG: hypothetical protein QOG77_1932, partial [Solirubrobacteraceae bacterium]|nr:hypothetical protein [Solirubrobacteraceae bacterium]